TTIMVTHDQEEALSFGDRLAVMRFGKIEQIGRPEQVYMSPDTAFVALFLGRTNLLRGVVEAGVAATSIGPVPVSTHAKGQALVSLRPDHLLLQAVNAEAGADGAAGARSARVRITKREFKGHVVAYEAVTTPAPGQVGAGAALQPAKGEERLVIYSPPSSELDVGDEAWVAVTGEGVPLRAGGTGG